MLNLLEAIRAAGLTSSVRFYQASTSELYGLVSREQNLQKARNLQGAWNLLYFLAACRVRRLHPCPMQVHEVPQSETTPFHPRSPYAVAKLYGFWITKVCKHFESFLVFRP